MWTTLLEYLFPEKKIHTLAFCESAPLSLPLPYTVLYQYSNELRKALHAIKFQNNKQYLDQLAMALLHDFKPVSIDIIIPIPTHPLRISKRGYEHTQKLIEKMAYFHKIPLRTDILYRQNNTQHLHNLNPQERVQELENSFVVWGKQGQALQGKNILLFDDIITTGNTLVAAYTELLKYKPKSIIALGLARPSFRQ